MSIFALYLGGYISSFALFYIRNRLVTCNKIDLAGASFLSLLSLLIVPVLFLETMRALLSNYSFTIKSAFLSKANKKFKAE